MFNCVDKQTDKLTNKLKQMPLKTSTSLRYATPLVKNSQETLLRHHGGFSSVAFFAKMINI